MIADPARARPGSRVASRNAAGIDPRHSDTPAEPHERSGRGGRAAHVAARAFGFAVVLGALAFVVWGWLSILL